VRHPHTPGPISSLLGTAGLPPSISFSTNYLELSRRNAHDAELPEADHSSDESMLAKIQGLVHL